MLAVRPPTGVQKVFNVRYFWLFTMFGLSVPYRIRFGKHCDELRVAVVKEVTIEVKPEYGTSSLSNSSWFSSPRSWLWGPDTRQDVVHDRREKFKQRMQEISLYKRAKEKAPPEPLMITDTANTNSTSEELSPVELSNKNTQEPPKNLTQINAPQGIDVIDKSNASDIIRDDEADGKEQEEDV